MVNKKTQGLPSPETQAEAMKIARATQKPGQNKEQTKLIAQGIQHGIEQYKKQQKAKARERDKLRKKQTRDRGQDIEPTTVETTESRQEIVESKQHWLPWLLLLASWLGFIGYLQLG
ncbi:DUF2956 domain-containing protein [Photobacterium sp. ZSDE20]|uniref:DUF2956 domain-containing protein n=1 Tax=Photobacterium pectinilyticum TaxID=2906793 RepID=A0ABT1MXA8_9GAMM|nr:DUF2956 domain-containing protein [Photobacterium sp. ZSDE20]MCQ1057115.1 DUF2956 domain-containing protein [Photobacterium sp. ZSDE20]MDD1821250.1 DUF2956 domain-containing protein [Photobacterium sp. ZSDE20]